MRFKVRCAKMSHVTFQLKYRSQSQNTLPKFQNRVWVTSFWLFLNWFEVLKNNQPQRCFPECSISKWPSLSHHPSFFRHGVTKTTKSWYTLMGGFFGNLFRVIWESHGDDDSQWKWEPYLSVIRNYQSKQFFRHGVTKTPGFKKYQASFTKCTFSKSKSLNHKKKLKYIN